jgi:hypothetical protein
VLPALVATISMIAVRNPMLARLGKRLDICAPSAIGRARSSAVGGTNFAAISAASAQTQSEDSPGRQQFRRLQPSRSRRCVPFD